MDKYDKAIAYYTKHPDLIHEDWADPNPGRPSELFKMLRCVNDSRRCPVMLREDTTFYTPPTKLAQRIANDERLPAKVDDLTLEHLPILAEYQRLDDAWTPEEG